MSQFVRSFIINVFAGCSHRKTTFPLTDSKSARKRTYVVCLDCGKEFDYSWNQMKIGEETTITTRSRAAVPLAH
jgi:hypothetical protein